MPNASKIYQIDALNAAAFDNKKIKIDLTENDRMEIAVHIAEKFWWHLWSSANQPKHTSSVLTFIGLIPNHVQSLLEDKDRHVSNIILAGHTPNDRPLVTTVFLAHQRTAEGNKAFKSLMQELEPYKGQYTIIKKQERSLTYT